MQELHEAQDGPSGPNLGVAELSPEDQVLQGIRCTGVKKTMQEVINLLDYFSKTGDGVSLTMAVRKFRATSDNTRAFAARLQTPDRLLAIQEECERLRRMPPRVM